MAEFTESTTIKVNCPGCQSEAVNKNGKQNGQQRYQCKSCGKLFRANGKPEGRRVDADQMGAAVRLFYSGLSYKQISESIHKVFDIPEPSKQTIYAWVKEYTDQAVKAMRRFRAQTGDTWVADEMQVLVGGEKAWNWNVMDAKTRYVLASYLSKERTARAATEVMRRARLSAATEPKVIKTDRLASYNEGIEAIFPLAKHVKTDGIRAEVNNNLSERLQGTFRQRIKTLRGLDNLESGQRYLDGWVITYNLFREHESLDFKTPGEVARVQAPFTEWADVVRGRATVLPVVASARSVARGKEGRIPQPKIAKLKGKVGTGKAVKPKGKPGVPKIARRRKVS